MPERAACWGNDCPWVQSPSTLVVSDSRFAEPRGWGAAVFISVSDRRSAPCRRHASQPHWPSGQLDLMPPSADTFSQGHVSKKRRHVALRRRLPRFFPGWWRRLNRSSVSRNGNRDGCLDRVEGGQTKQGAMTEATAQALDRCTEPCRRHASVRSGYTSLSYSADQADEFRRRGRLVPLEPISERGKCRNGFVADWLGTAARLIECWPVTFRLHTCVHKFLRSSICAVTWQISPTASESLLLAFGATAERSREHK